MLLFDRWIIMIDDIDMMMQMDAPEDDDDHDGCHDDLGCQFGDRYTIEGSDDENEYNPNEDLEIVVFVWLVQ